MNKGKTVTSEKSSWICPNPKCETIYPNPPAKCAKCGYENKVVIERAVLDNLISEKRGSRKNQI